MAQLLLLLGGGLRRALALAIGFIDCSSLEGTLEGANRVSFLARDCDDSAASRHFEDIVDLMGHRHELGQSWVPEDGIVWQTNVGHIKVVPLGEVNLFMLRTRSLETIFIAICILPKSGVNTLHPYLFMI